MELSIRDRDIVRLVGMFGQLATPHIAVILFGDRTATTLDRALQRLVDRKLLIRIGRRASGLKGGAGAYVYQLAPYGWDMEHKHGTFHVRKVGDQTEHTLHMADVLVDLITAQREGKLQLLLPWGADLERKVSEDVRADMYIEIGAYNPRRKLDFYIEVDRRTEKDRIIKKKLDDYWDASTKPNAGAWPYVVFVVPHEWRKMEIERIIKRKHMEVELFSVCTFPQLVQHLLSFE